MASEEDVASSEASFLELRDCLVNIGVDQDGLGCVEDELRQANPDPLAGRSTLRLDLGSEGSVGIRVYLHAMDPDDGNLVAGRGSGGRRQDRVVCRNRIE